MNRTIRLLICLLGLFVIGCSSAEPDPADGAGVPAGPVEPIAPQEEEYDPNAIDDEGWTPIMWAVRDGDASEIAALLDSGADPNAVDKGNNGCGRCQQV